MFSNRKILTIINVQFYGDGKLDSILLQGSIDYSGIYQYLIKHEIDLSGMEKDVFHLSFADFYGVKENGGYCYQNQT